LTASAPPRGIVQNAIGPRLLVRDRDHVVFTYDRVVAMIWQHDTTEAAVSQASRLVAGFVQRLTPKRFCLLTVVEISATAPSSGSRAGLAKLLQDNTPYLIRSAVGYEGTGFRGAAFRGVATGIAVLSNHPFPHRIFAGVPDATEWLASGLSSELGGALQGVALADVVRKMRQVPDPQRH
jgi:hypothetical protein